MAINPVSRLKAFFEKAFPERQIYHRSGGSVRYVSISPWRQAMMAGVATIVVGWCMFATAAVLLRGPAMTASSGVSDRKSARLERELKQARSQEQIALQLLEKRTTEFEQHIQDAEARHNTLKILLAHLQGQDSSTAVALAGDNASLLVDSSIEEADARQAHSDPITVASNDTAGFRAKINKLQVEQASFLDAAEDEAVDRAERARGIIKLTGVQLSRVSGQDQNGQGGPLVEVADMGNDPFMKGQPADGFTRRAQEVAARLSEANNYEKLIHTLPIGSPLEVDYRETSGFGYRSDPFKKTTAWHDGADIAAFLGATIVTTAPGIVTFAGTKNGYGRVVEIDHGGGFKTRYGHMNSIAVKQGQKLAIGQKVGTMGSSGRSTGPHLHYEVYFRGKAYDPIKFLRAGKHVHEG